MVIEKYSEDLNKYIDLVHEASEGRYVLTGYDLHVIESALDQFKDQNSEAQCFVSGIFTEKQIETVYNLPLDIKELNVNYNSLNQEVIYSRKTELGIMNLVIDNNGDIMLSFSPYKGNGYRHFSEYEENNKEEIFEKFLGR